jgi:hypothetical protein
MLENSIQSTPAADKSSKVNMQSQPWNGHRAAITVVSRVDSILEIDSRENTTPDVEIVVSLENLLAAIGQITISEQKALATQLEI